MNDATLMRDVLLQRFGIPAENIASLINTEATRDKLTQAFRQHLIERAQAAARSGPSAQGATYLFYYAGHGSRARDLTGTQSDGFDETIVPHDSRTGEVYDIRDWELRGWLEELNRWTTQVTVIFDCCHAGGATRDDEEVGTARSCPPDLRSQLVTRPEAEIRPGTRGDGDAPYTFLAACQNFESAKEYAVPHEPTRAQGAFTWFLCQELNQLNNPHEISCRELMNRVRYQVHSRYQSQLPLCEGDRDRSLLGGARSVADPHFIVEEIVYGDLWINAGAVHGVSLGGTFRPLKSADERVALPVVEVQATRCRCQVPAGVSIPQFAKVSLADRGVGINRRAVFLDRDVRNNMELVSRLQSAELSSVIRVVESDSAADYRIVALAPAEGASPRLGIRDRRGQLLTEPVDDRQVDTIVLDLLGLCRYRNLLELRNQNLDSALTGKLRIELHEVVTESTAADPATRQRDVRTVAPIRRTADGLPIVEVGKAIAISVTNQSNQPLFCEAVSLGYDYAIVPLSGILSAARNIKRVDPGGVLWFGRDRSERKIVFTLPADPAIRSRFVEAREFLKIFATQTPTDYEVLRQDGLRLPVTNHRATMGSALDGYFHRIMSGSSRALGAQDDTVPVTDWTTVEQEYLVLQPGSQGGLLVGENSSVSLPNYPVSVTTPVGCSLQVRPQSDLGVRQAIDAEGVPTSGPARQLDPIGCLTALSLHSAQPAVPAATALDLTLSSESMTRVSESAPIELQLSAGHTAPVLAFAWNGELAIPVGCSSGDGRIRIASLSEEMTLPTHAGVSEGTRGLAQTIRLYLFQMVGLQPPDQGLYEFRSVESARLTDLPPQPNERCVPHAGGEWRYRPFDLQAVGANRRVLLIIPGFGVSSSEFWEQLQGRCDAGFSQYGSVLTYDYECYRSSVVDSAKKLMESLRVAGLSANDQIQLDVIGEGMGAMVGRAMVELLGANEFVDRCCWIGPFNQGTPWAGIQNRLKWMGTLAIQLAAPMLAKSLLSTAWNKVNDDAIALNDLAPQSAFLAQLTRQGNRARVRYLIIAGSFTPSAALATGWQKLLSLTGLIANRVLGLYFAGQHDLMASLASLTTVGDGMPAGTLQITIVPCHHFEYLGHPGVAEHLVTWMTNSDGIATS